MKCRPCRLVSLAFLRFPSLLLVQAVFALYRLNIIALIEQRGECINRLFPKPLECVPSSFLLASRPVAPPTASG